MFNVLYTVAGLAFVAGIGSYWFFCLQLADDIQSGKIRIKAEGQSS